MTEIKNILRDSNGDIDVIIKYEDTNQVVKAPASMMIRENDGRVAKLVALLGDDNVKLV